MYWPSPEENVDCQESMVCPPRKFTKQRFNLQKVLNNMESDQPTYHESRGQKNAFGHQKNATGTASAHSWEDVQNEASMSGIVQLEPSRKHTWLEKTVLQTGKKYWKLIVAVALVISTVCVPSVGLRVIKDVFTYMQRQQ